MTQFPVIVRYLTDGGHRKRYEYTVTAGDKREARATARALYEADRKRLPRTKTTITSVVVGDPIEPPVVPGLCEKADVLDQIRALLGTPARDPRIGKVGTVSFDGSDRIECTVVAVFNKLSGAERVVIEDDRGLLSIHAPSDLNL